MDIQLRGTVNSSLFCLANQERHCVAHQKVTRCQWLEANAILFCYILGATCAAEPHTQERQKKFCKTVETEQIVLHGACTTSLFFLQPVHNLSSKCFVSVQEPHNSLGQLLCCAQKPSIHRFSHSWQPRSQLPQFRAMLHATASMPLLILRAPLQMSAAIQ